MKITSIRKARVGAAILALVAVPATPAGPAAATPGRCSPGTGVTVVVDYGPLGGGVVIACDPDGAGKSAAEVVTDAGFSLQYVSSQPGFVCRVNGQPGEADEDCGDTPPPDAYWGLFWSDADPESWSYSSEGVGSLDVPEGGSIGWRFQDGGDREIPSAAPTAKAKAPSPQPTKHPSPQPSGSSEAAGPSASPTPPPSVPPEAGGAASPRENPEPDRKRRSGEDGAEADEAGGDDNEPGKGGRHGKGRHRPDDEEHAEQSAAPSPAVEALAPASDEPLSDVDSSPVLTLVAGGAVLLLAGSAGVIAWRRRV